MFKETVFSFFGTEQPADLTFVLAVVSSGGSSLIHIHESVYKTKFVRLKALQTLS